MAWPATAWPTRCAAGAGRSGSRPSWLWSTRRSRWPCRTDSGNDGIAEALAALPETDAELLRLWAWEQLTATEIADALEITPNAASVRLHRAKEKLRAHLDDRLGKSDAGAGHEESREGRQP